MLKILVIAGFLIIFVLSVVFIKPLQAHKKRPQSTPVLKFSYLAYLAVTLSFFYNLIFEQRNMDETITNFHFFIILLTLFIPNACILARRKIKKGRTLYNYLISVVNVAAIYYLVWFFVRIKITI